MSTADAPRGSDGCGGVQKLALLKRSRGAHRGVPTRRATAIRQAGGALEEKQATLEFLIDNNTVSYYFTQSRCMFTMRNF